MLNNTEMSALRVLRIKLLHYWQKFPEESVDKKALNEWQNVLDKIIMKEQKKIDYSGEQNGKK